MYKYRDLNASYRNMFNSIRIKLMQMQHLIQIKMLLLFYVTMNCTYIL